MVRYFKSLTSPLKSHDDTKIYRKHPQNLFIFINKWAFYPKLLLTDGRSTFFHCSNCTKVFLSLQCSHRLIIGPESDHCLPLSLTHSLTHYKLTHSCLIVNFFDVTLACEDANSKLVDVVTVADVDDICSDFEYKVW